MPSRRAITKRCWAGSSSGACIGLAPWMGVIGAGQDSTFKQEYHPCNVREGSHAGLQTDTRCLLS